jgi:hypothetical protein
VRAATGTCLQRGSKPCMSARCEAPNRQFVHSARLHRGRRATPANLRPTLSSIAPPTSMSVQARTQPLPLHCSSPSPNSRRLMTHPACAPHPAPAQTTTAPATPNCRRAAPPGVGPPRWSNPCPHLSGCACSRPMGLPYPPVRGPHQGPPNHQPTRGTRPPLLPQDTKRRTAHPHVIGKKAPASTRCPRCPEHLNRPGPHRAGRTLAAAVRPAATKAAHGATPRRTRARARSRTGLWVPCAPLIAPITASLAFPYLAPNPRLSLPSPPPPSRLSPPRFTR